MPVNGDFEGGFAISTSRWHGPLPERRWRAALVSMSTHAELKAKAAATHNFEANVVYALARKPHA